MCPESSAYAEEEEYDDLDDLLDEDPSKLPGVKQEGREKDPKAPDTVENEDPEVQEMINELQKEFSSLMEDDLVDQKQKEEQAKNFNQILETLSKTGQASNNSALDSEPQGFKNVVSKTLNRLKENGSKVDTNLAQEEKQRNTDDILSQLLEQLGGTGEGSELGLGENEGEMDNAILGILNQMSSKEVLYQPMKEMHIELGKWLDDHGADTEHAAKMDSYKKQHEVVAAIVDIYELDTYSNDAYREEITNLLDDLEQLGDSPVSKGFNNPNKQGDGAEDIDNLEKLLEISGDDQNLGNLDKELQDTCKQQ